MAFGYKLVNHLFSAMRATVGVNVGGFQMFQTIYDVYNAIEIPSKTESRLDDFKRACYGASKDFLHQNMISGSRDRWEGQSSPISRCHSICWSEE